MKLSATIIAFNEEANIARAIKSVQFADEVVVIDSCSQDRTAQIAEELGARVIQNQFIGFGQQKNFAADQANGEWILSIDADEEVDEELKQSVLAAINSEAPASVYYINRKTFYCNKWIRYGGWFPDYINRLYKKDSARWSEPKVHERVIPLDSSLKPLPLSGFLNHYSFPSVESQVLVNIKYAKLGSKHLTSNGKKPGIFKTLIKSLGKFLECYIIKLGILDGRRGLIISLNASYSIFLKYIFTYEHNGNLND